MGKFGNKIKESELGDLSLNDKNSKYGCIFNTAAAFTIFCIIFNLLESIRLIDGLAANPRSPFALISYIISFTFLFKYRKKRIKSYLVYFTISYLIGLIISLSE